MNSENLHVKEEFTSILMLPTRTGAAVVQNAAGVGPEIFWSWEVDWGTVFHHYPRYPSAQTTYQVTHEFTGDGLSGPILPITYTPQDVIESPQTTNFIVGCSFADVGGVGSLPTQGGTNQRVINTIQWDTPMGAVTLDTSVSFFAVRKATPSEFICHNPEVNTTVVIRMLPNKATYDPTYMQYDTGGVHTFRFKLLK